MTDNSPSTRLQILICTIGAEGIKRVCNAAHPRIAGVEYLVLWQQPDTDIPVPEALAERTDFKVFTHRSRGISRNRNFAIEHSSAPLALMGDDDIDYSEDGILELLKQAEENRDADILLCRYKSNGKYVKPYPEAACLYRKVPKGYYVSALEIAFRPSAVRNAGLWFNENISIGTPVLKCGEEDVFVRDALIRKLTVMVVPACVGSHDHASTSERDAKQPYFAMTHGAVMMHMHPATWIPRVMVHALRESKAGRWSWWRYFTLCLKGAAYARRNKVFKSQRVN